MICFRLAATFIVKAPTVLFVVKDARFNANARTPLIASNRAIRNDIFPSMLAHRVTSLISPAVYAQTRLSSMASGDILLSSSKALRGTPDV